MVITAAGLVRMIRGWGLSTNVQAVRGKIVSKMFTYLIYDYPNHFKSSTLQKGSAVYGPANTHRKQLPTRASETNRI